MRVWTALSLAVALAGCQTPAGPAQVEEGATATGPPPAARAAAPDDSNARAERLLADLGARDFRLREKATEELLKMGDAALPVLLGRLADPDIEVRLRVQALLLSLVPPPIKTQQFEGGELSIEEVDSGKLEAFLRDLCLRRNHDRAQNGGGDGPDAQYLTEWIDRATQELLRRGYTLDSGGTLRRPGVEVKLPK